MSGVNLLSKLRHRWHKHIAGSIRVMHTCLRKAMVDCEARERGPLDSAPVPDGDPGRTTVHTKKQLLVDMWPQPHVLNFSVPLFTHAQNGNISDNPLERSLYRLSNPMNIICFTNTKCCVTWRASFEWLFPSIPSSIAESLLFPLTGQKAWWKPLLSRRDSPCAGAVSVRTGFSEQRVDQKQSQSSAMLNNTCFGVVHFCF